MARSKLGKKFRTKKGKWGRYKYVNGKRVATVKAQVRRSKK